MPINFNSLNIGAIARGTTNIGSVYLGTTKVWPTDTGTTQPPRALGWVIDYSATTLNNALTGNWDILYSFKVLEDPKSYTNVNVTSSNGPPYNEGPSFSDYVDLGPQNIPGWNFTDNRLYTEIYTGDAGQEDDLILDYVADLTAYDNYMTLAVNTIVHPNTAVQPLTFQVPTVTYDLGSFGYWIAHGGFDAPTQAAISTFFYDLQAEVGAGNNCSCYLVMGNANGTNAFNGLVDVTDTEIYGDTFTTYVQTADQYLYNGLNIALNNKYHYISELSSQYLNVVRLPRTNSPSSIVFEFGGPYPGFKDDFYNFRFTRDGVELFVLAEDFTTSDNVTWTYTHPDVFNVLMAGSSSSSAVPLEIKYTPV